ncbi:unnamed protein product [Orchesella dallaii]|uniref:Uncharacterized protein n=1 Tax=Orchesella dallaii TaxID=48710 RepID=A0ABP1R4L6_9HEXA
MGGPPQKRPRRLDDMMAEGPRILDRNAVDAVQHIRNLEAERAELRQNIERLEAELRVQADRRRALQIQARELAAKSQQLSRNLQALRWAIFHPDVLTYSYVLYLLLLGYTEINAVDESVDYDAPACNQYCLTVCLLICMANMCNALYRYINVVYMHANKRSWLDIEIHLTRTIMGGPPGERPRHQSSRFAEMMNSGPRILERSEVDVALQRLFRHMYNEIRNRAQFEEYLHREDEELQVLMRQRERLREREENGHQARIGRDLRANSRAAYVCIYACILYLRLLGGTGRDKGSSRSTDNVAKWSLDETWLD